MKAHLEDRVERFGLQLLRTVGPEHREHPVDALRADVLVPAPGLLLQLRREQREERRGILAAGRVRQLGGKADRIQLIRDARTRGRWKTLVVGGAAECVDQRSRAEHEPDNGERPIVIFRPSRRRLGGRVRMGSTVMTRRPLSVVVINIDQDGSNH